jgi:23S rRNA-/tRNA-specific pseudouridylate synthase
MNYKWIVKEEDANSRLLSFIKKRITEKTTVLRFAIEHQGCRVNQRVERFCSRRLEIGETVEFRLEKRPTLALQQQAILYEDDHLLIYAKPARLSSEELSQHFQLELIHRLDRDTTGILVFAKDSDTKQQIERLFKKREVEKSYLAIVHGQCSFEQKKIQNKLALIKRLPGKVVWGVSNSGFQAITEVKTLKKGKEHSYIQLYPKTGRTHQLRVQLSHLGYPIVGDVDYGKKESWDRRTLLHAYEIHFSPPHLGTRISIQCPLPSDFKRELERLF